MLLFADRRLGADRKLGLVGRLVGIGGALSRNSLSMYAGLLPPVEVRDKAIAIVNAFEVAGGPQTIYLARGRS